MHTLNFKLSFVFAIVSIYIAFFALDKAQMEFWYIKTAYFFIFINFSIWLYKLWNILPSFSELKGFIKFHKNAIVLSMLIAVFIFFAFKPELRILSDETNLLSISKGMVVYPHNVLCIMSEAEKNDSFKLVSYSLDKRPLFFSFVLSLFHCLVGYSYLNAFLLNFISLFMCLFLLYYVIYIFFDKFYGYLSIVIMASYPLIVSCASSAGFEVFDILWAFVVFIVFNTFLSYKDAKWAEFLIYTALLFAQTRYEELAILPVVVLLVWVYLDKNQFKYFSKVFSIFPIFCIPSVWRNVITYDPAYFEFGKDAKIYSLEHFFKNIMESMYFLLGHDSGCMVNFFSIMAVAGLFIFIYDYVKLKRKKILYYVILFYGIHILLKFSFIGCLLYKPMEHRLAAIFIPLFVVLNVFYLFKLANKYNLNKSYLVSLLFFILIFSWSKVNFETYYRLYMRNYLYAVKQSLEIHLPKKNEYLLVSLMPNLFSVLNYHSIDFDRFNKDFVNFKKDIVNNKSWKYIVFIDSFFTIEGHSYQGLEEDFKKETKKVFMREFYGGILEASVWNPNDYDLM